MKYRCGVGKVRALHSDELMGLPGRPVIRCADEDEGDAEGRGCQEATRHRAASYVAIEASATEVDLFEVCQASRSFARPACPTFWV
jgi:hypothetical protein